MDFRNKILARARQQYPAMSLPERLVLTLIIKADDYKTANDGKVTQKEIADMIAIGSHPIFEDYAKTDSTLRRIRGVVCDLRNKYGILVISLDSSNGGYWIPRSVQEAQEFYEANDRKARAQALTQRATVDRIGELIAYFNNEGEK